MSGNERGWSTLPVNPGFITSDPRCQEWVSSQFLRSEGTLLHAESALALAEGGRD